MTTKAKPQPYGYSRTLDLGFEEALEHARNALQAEGFGVLCEIDIREKLKAKLGIDFRNYVILGACNPPLAYRALQEDIHLGLLLPCNVVVYEQEGRSVIAAIDAKRMLAVADQPALQETAREVDEKLRRVIDSL